MRAILARAVTAIVLLLAATSVVSSRSLGWGAADAPDGTRFKVSPLGLSHVLQPHQTISPTEDCRWREASGLCALRPQAPAARLVLLTLPGLLWAAALVAGLGAAAWLLPVPQLHRFRHLGTILPPVLTGAALTLFAWAVPRASQTLSALAFGVGGTKATLQLALQIALLLGFTAKTVAGPGRGPPRCPAHAATTAAVG